MKKYILIFLCNIPIYAYGNYIDNGNGTITDNITGLVWQKCSMGQNVLDCSGTASATTWVNAISYCNNLELALQTDWRLPNINELKSLVDYNQVGSAINNLFLNTIAWYYWSSTSSAYNASSAWVVDFRYHNTIYPYKTDSNYVRCVR
jgi:hypothetical protein